MKKNRFIALILCVAVVFVMLFSSFYIAREADHDCIGEGCQICVHIENCEHNLKKLITAVIAVAIAIALTYYFQLMRVYTAEVFSVNTLVTLKVKLSN